MVKRRTLTSGELEVTNRITEPLNWVDSETLIQVIRDNPSLRGFVYGYVAEQRFAEYIENSLGIKDHTKDDDHAKTKSDRTFLQGDRTFTIQLKSLQTNTIREIAPDTYKATVQNDASDRRKVALPDNSVVETTCYVAGEYDVLAVSIQPFTGGWRFAFKKNKNLQHTNRSKYTDSQKQYLLATTETIVYPLQPESGWTTDLLSLLTDADLGRAFRVTASENETITEIAAEQGPIVIEESNNENSLTS